MTAPNNFLLGSVILGRMNTLRMSFEGFAMRRVSAPIAAAMLLVGGACESSGKKEQPSPQPAPIVTDHTVAPLFISPSCAVRIDRVIGKRVIVTTEAEDYSEHRMYTLDEVRYRYGDGPEEAGRLNKQQHIYKEDGTYTVGASIVIDVAPGVLYRGAKEFVCKPTVVTVPQ